jgi:pSer/pThr/pTyr-binding forkhead associated (FHA) protein
MQVADRSASALEIHAQMWAAFRKAPLTRHLDVVLKPLSRPGLGEIRIDDAVLAIGRTEQPFASYGNDVLNMLSRRHARIFRKDGFVYLADLGSRNGTKVNRVAVGRAHCKLRDGDEICFGGALTYRVQITPYTRPEGSLTLRLTPKSGDSGLDTIEIAKFPFLVSKTGPTFSNYKSKREHARQLTYLSRRHAYIYQRGGQACIQDLGSSNGTFVDGQRLREHPVPLQDGVVVAFGGKHFVYEVSVSRQCTVEAADGGAREPSEPSEPSEPQASVSIDRQQVVEGDHSAAREPVAECEASEPQAYDRTQFMAAPTSFLQIYCEAEAPRDEVAPGGSAVPADAAKEPAVRRRPRGRTMLLLSELASLHASGEPDSVPRRGWWWWKAAAVAGTLGALALTAYFWTAPERDLKNAVARGEYARAATLAGRLLEKHPDDLELKARATEVVLKANVPAWLTRVQARDFDGAKAVLTRMSELAMRDADLSPLIDELEWLGNLERLVSGRGGPEAPIRIYADEDSIEQLIGRWNDDTGDHQRALDRIASYVPQFGDWYGEALTHLRRLQSESTVYLPVIERLKSNVATELGRDNPDALEPELKETAEKYPGLGGLDGVRQELALYIEIRREARTRESGRLFALLRKARFVTPPFQKSFRTLTESGQLPPADLLQQYEAATRAWKDGNSDEAFAALQKLATGPWGEEAAKELERRRGVAARFAAIQQSRNAAVDQLLAFRESLDPEEDAYFVRATEAGLNLQRDTVIARAQDELNRARASWQDYQSNGAIDASQRIETSVSEQFRARARLLAEASSDAQQGFVLYSLVDPAGAAQWTAIRDEIESEAREQRNKLHDLSNVIEPELLKTKLALLGEANE